MKSTRKIMSIILSVMLILSCVPMSAINVSAVADLTTTIDTGAQVTLRDTNGDGYYEISTADELYAFASIVNGGKLSTSAILTKDIVVNDCEITENTTDVREWTPIGGRNKVYTGTFDGNNKTISGLYKSTTASYAGLFGYLHHSGVIKNVGVLNSYLNGKNYVGGIVGMNHGQITNCYNAGIINGEVTVGGVVGYLSAGEVTRCYNKGKINSQYHAGGVIGIIYMGVASNCYNEGAVYGKDGIGGIAGINVYNATGLLINSYNVGVVTGIYSDGGIMGEDNTKNIKNCYYLNTTCTGGIEGKDFVGLGEAATTEQFASGEVAYFLQCEQTEAVWGQTIGTDMFPVYDGATVYQIKKCNENKIYYRNEKEESIHIPIAITGYDSTCDKTGLTDGIGCSVCKEVLTPQEVIDMKEHTSQVVKGYDSTCVKTGLTDGVECSVCKHILTPQEVIDKKEHSYEVSEGYDATCTETGLQDGFKCTVCGDVQQEIIPAKGHTLNENQICTVCGYEYPGAVDSDGDGFYEIDNATKLYWLAQEVNSGNTSINAILTKDITVNAGTITAESTDSKAWMPIGNKNAQYSGIFDGNNKTISGLYFNDSSYRFVGLFGYLTENSVVKNLSVTNSYFNGSAYVGSVAGISYGGSFINCHSSNIVNANENYSYVGGVVGYLSRGVVEDCNNTGAVSGSNYVGGVIGYFTSGIVKNCYNLGTISGNGYVGGVIGLSGNGGETINCYNAGKIKGNNNYVGGVIGDSGGPTSNCYNKGDVISKGDYVGGVAGYGHGTTINVHNEGNVSGNEYVGGVIGEIKYSSSIKKITNCKNTGKVNGYWYVGGVFGASFVDASNSYNTGTVSGNTGVGGVVGYSESKISNCYNIGIVKSTGFYVGSVAGRSYTGLKSQGELVNCYYLKDVAVSGQRVIQNGVGTAYGEMPTPDVKGETTVKSAEQFESGEVAYLLGEAFGQTIGTDKYPVFDGAKVYQGYGDCGMIKNIYSNSPMSGEIPDCNHEIGDVDHDGKMTIRDASTISKYLADCITLSERQLIKADANGDGEINVNDATYIQKIIAEII